MPVVDVVPMKAAHADAVLEVYRAGIEAGDATFETVVPTWAQFDAAHLVDHRFVACAPHGVAGGPAAVLGWAAVSPVSAREAYRGVVEDSVYVAPSAQGGGVGTTLLERLLASTDAGGIWTVRAGVFPENEASLRLHLAAGFRVVGVHERIGRSDRGWRDVVLLERRVD